MATYNTPRCAYQTLSTTTVDTVTLTAGMSGELHITNLSTTQLLAYTVDGSTPAVATAGGNIVPTGMTVRVSNPLGDTLTVKVIGNANPYIVQLI